MVDGATVVGVVVEVDVFPYELVEWSTVTDDPLELISVDLVMVD